jgi:hypothetical protein
MTLRPIFCGLISGGPIWDVEGVLLQKPGSADRNRPRWDVECCFYRKLPVELKAKAAQYAMIDA